MKTSTLLRIAAVCFFLIFLGHTFGHFASPSRGFAEETLFKAMQGLTFDVVGSTRSHWDFYRGNSLMTSVFMLVLACLTWVLSGWAPRAPRESRPILAILIGAALATSLISFTNFFVVPVMALVAALLLGGATKRGLQNK